MRQMTQVPEEINANSPNAWTIAYRKRTANRFLRVSDWSGTWQQAYDLAGRLATLRPDLQVYYVTSETYEAAERARIAAGQVQPHLAEDHGNVLVDSGKRVRTVDAPMSPDVRQELFPPVAPVNTTAAAVTRALLDGDEEAIEQMAATEARVREAYRRRFPMAVARVDSSAPDVDFGEMAAEQFRVAARQARDAAEHRMHTGTPGAECAPNCPYYQGQNPCPITGKAQCAERSCELHYMDAPLNIGPEAGA